MIKSSIERRAVPERRARRYERSKVEHRLEGLRRERKTVAEYTLPDLPYDYAALEPHISGKVYSATGFLSLLKPSSLCSTCEHSYRRALLRLLLLVSRGAITECCGRSRG